MGTVVCVILDKSIHFLNLIQSTDIYWAIVSDIVLGAGETAGHKTNLISDTWSS